MYNVDLGYPKMNILHTSVFTIQPYKSYRSLSYGLRDYPWMAQHIREVELYLPDKDIDAIICAGEIFRDGYAYSGERTLPMYRLQALSRSTHDQSLNLKWPALAWSSTSCYVLKL